MLKNAPFLITIGVDTAENEPRKGWYVVARPGSPGRPSSLSARRAEELAGAAPRSCAHRAAPPVSGEELEERQLFHPSSDLPNLTGHGTSPFPRLVLSCIDADRNEKWRIFQHFTKSIRIYIFLLKNI